MKLSSAFAALLLLPSSCSLSPTFFSSHNGAFSIQASKPSPSYSTTSWAQYEQKLTSRHHQHQRQRQHQATSRLSLSAEPGTEKGSLTEFSDPDQNKLYVEGLLLNLSTALDRWIVNGSLTTVSLNLGSYPVMSCYTLPYHAIA